MYENCTCFVKRTTPRGLEFPIETDVNVLYASVKDTASKPHDWTRHLLVAFVDLDTAPKTRGEDSKRALFHNYSVSAGLPSSLAHRASSTRVRAKH